MKSIHQFVDTLVPGDAISNESLQIRKYLLDQGYNSDIYTQASLINERYVKKYYSGVRPEDGIIFHHSTHSPLVEYVSQITNKKILIYHNITPAAYFKAYNYNLYRHFKEAERQNKLLSQGRFNAVIGDSQYNLSLIKDIAKAPIHQVLPPFLSLQFPRIKQKKTDEPLNEKNEFNILFVGRFAPNKRQDDILHVFEYYQKYINPHAHLYLLGLYAYVDPYFSQIMKYLDERNIKNITIRAHLTSEELAHMYTKAHVFLSMSEHEGFCIPVLEAIHFGVPVVAYKIPALEELLPKQYLFEHKDIKKVAQHLYALEQSSKQRREVVKDQRSILNKFKEQSLQKKLQSVISRAFNV